MSKGLEALVRLSLHCNDYDNLMEVDNDNDYFSEAKDYALVYKQLQALEIIIKNEIDLGTLSVIYTLKYDYGNYLLNAKRIGYLLTKEEFDLLKEAMEQLIID